MKRKELFHGIFPPLATPFLEDGDLDLNSLKENIKRLNKTGLSGYVVLGSNGEYVYLNKEERLKAIEAVLEFKKEDMKVIAGTGCESLQETIDFTQKTHGMGVDGALIITPHYYKGGMTTKVLSNYYQKVAEHIELPLLLYNVPKNTGINMNSSLIAELAHHENIVGIKDSSGNIAQLSEILIKTEEEDFTVLVGTASVLSSAIALGAKGGVLALANIAPAQCIEIKTKIEEGRVEEAQRMQMKMLPVNTAITASYGVPGLKVAMDLLGYKGGYPRQPLLPLESNERDALGKILREANLL